MDVDGELVLDAAQRPPRRGWRRWVRGSDGDGVGLGVSICAADPGAARPC